MKALVILLLLTHAALAQTFPVGPHLSIKNLPSRKYLLIFHGRPWPGKPPVLSELRLQQESFGEGQITLERPSDLANLSTWNKTGRATTGIRSSREEKRSCAWLSEGPQGGCLILEDLKRAHWVNENNLEVNPVRTPVLASIWMTPADLKTLSKGLYKAMAAQRR